MCGITFEALTRRDAGFVTDDSFVNLSHRGPDSCTTYRDNVHNVSMRFDRLHVTSPEDGRQPFVSAGRHMMCNGEIYNYKDLIKKYDLHVVTGSDCEVLLQLYLKRSIESFLDDVDGEFAFVIWDTKTRRVYYARDTFGVRPLYVYHDDTRIVLSSEAVYENQDQVVPSTLYMYDLTDGSTRAFASNQRPLVDPLFYRPSFNIRMAFIASVMSRIAQGDRPVGFFLSGGLDSSLILSVACKLYSAEAVPAPPTVQCFTIGAKDSKDTRAAIEVVDFLRKKHPFLIIRHHIVPMDPDEAFAKIGDLIDTIRTYDTTTVRASMGQYMLAEYISRHTDIRVVISGEGADELLGGYLYFRYAPEEFKDRMDDRFFVDAYRNSSMIPPRTGRPFKREVMRLMNDLYVFDNLRTDRTTAAFGLEVRVPFLQNEFVATVMMHPDHTKEPGTKNLMRRAFADGCLPDSVLWGTKEAFSDGVGHSWLDTIREKVASMDFSSLEDLPEGCDTQEKKFYYSIWKKNYAEWKDPLPFGYWVPRWVDTKGEASARALSVYT